MSIKIDSGLFKFDFIDHHAVLGVPVDAELAQIRKRYLQIARRLHPDSCIAANAAEKQLSSQLLSKLVNPAYEKFSKDSSHAEYGVLLREISKRLVQESNAIELKSELSKQLNQTNNIDHLYKTSLHQLTEHQYDSLAEVLQIIAQISELNLVYLLRKGGSGLQILSPSQATVTNGGTPAKPPLPQPESVVEQYIRRAQALIEKNNLPLARVELQDALKLEPNNSRCHSLIGVVYLKQNQTTMAKVHINKALQLNPQEPMALKGKQMLEQLGQKVNGQPTAASKSVQSKQTDKSGGGSMFGGLFGGKKK